MESCHARVALPCELRLKRWVVSVDAIAEDVQLALLELDSELNQCAIGDAVDLDGRNEQWRACRRLAGGRSLAQLAVAGERVVVADRRYLDAPVGHRAEQLIGSQDAVRAVRMAVQVDIVHRPVGLRLGLDKSALDARFHAASSTI